MPFDAGAFEQALTRGDNPLQVFRAALRDGDARLRERFQQGAAAGELVTGRAGLIDLLLVKAWRRFVEPGATDAALVAVGGYGRGELHPGSDIDLMILLGDEAHELYRDRIERFLVFLWDIGLEVGHSVRSLADCARESRQDITVATNLMEARLLDGSPALFDAMRSRTGPDRIWSSRRFFEAKWREQQQRHHKFHDTAYKLEPNVKEGPGGLRDIQMVGWVAKRHFGAATLRDLVGHGFLTDTEYQALMAGQEFLWQVRFALHVLTGRREDRLLFDHQCALAGLFGYRDQGHDLAVEQFMQRYYRTVMDLERLNEMLLQLFQEAILYADDPGAPVSINKRFQARKGFIEVKRDNVFQRYPFALLEIFLLLQQHPELKGVRAATIRLIRDHRHLIDETFRNDLRARSLFMEILRQPRGVVHELRRMNRYGVLAAYLPAFGRIVGRMQYDLFHVYTVDEHSLFVVRNLRRYTVPEFAHEFPLCSEIIQQLPKPELLYLAGLFHDIAKGRGGDHSELGAHDAEAFCLHHGLSGYDARLVAWMVRHHLIMSMTAQRRDISDPEVINDFAHKVRDQTHLNYLYLLTVADIRATNPNLWNSWKDSLLRELYGATKRALRRGLENPIDPEERIAEIQAQARATLTQRGMDDAAIDTVWGDFSDEYFLRHNAEEVAWHTQAIAGRRPDDLPLVLVRQQTQRGGTAIFLYARDQGHLFALTTSALEQLALTIVDARIISSRSGCTLDTYLVLEDTGEPIATPLRVQEIQTALKRQLHQPGIPPSDVSRHTPRQLKHFPTPTQVAFSDDERNRRTVMELIAADRPGLLSRVGRAFMECGVRVQNAKIATLGARAEDVFFITDEHNQPLTRQEQFQCLRDTIKKHLET
ncbi:MAG: [protein-PII] uridylyltransferase [Gammaproteobacteria bacterium]|nr:[protein-PII] uridylyltransferase [Gammaproteobacteria bacterium]